MGPTSNSNQFFGVKVSQIGIPVNQAADSQLVYKSNFSTNLFNGPNGIWKVMEGTRVPTIGNGLTAPQQGFWVAEDGVDVQQATDSQMVFNSSRPSIKFSVYLNATSQSIPSGSDTVVAFDTKFFDTGNNVDVTTNMGRFTAPFTGIYQFQATFNGPNNTGAAWITGFHKNGIDFIRLNQIQAAWVAGSTLMLLEAGDYVECFVFQNTGSSQNLTGALGTVPAASTTFSGFSVQ